MASILKFDTWQNSSGVTHNVPLQVVSNVFTSQISTTSTSYTDAFSVTVTPKASGSKWSIDCAICFSDNGRGYDANTTEAKLRVYNSFTSGVVSPAVSTGNSYNDGTAWWGWDAEQGYGWSDESKAYLIKNVKWIGEATGSTAGSAITFTVQWKVAGNTGWINRVYQSAQSGAGVSTIRVMEIAQ